MRILFMGTPDIAAKSLQGLILAGHEICGAFTRQDKPVGRKQILTPPPTKVVALENNIPVFQPNTLKEPEIEQQIRQLSPEIIVVVAYGRILPKQILCIPQYGCVNLHVSQLPKYRGAAPVQWAVINGDKTTGVTIMYMDEGLDTGDIIETEIVEIDANETSGELFEKVTQTGIDTLCKTLDKIKAGTARRVVQDESLVTWAPPLSKEMARVSFALTAQALHNLVRGLNPWPIAYFVAEDKNVKITKSRLSDLSGAEGEILSTKPLTVGCSQGAIQLIEVVPEGKKPMDGTSFAAGKRLKKGDFIC